MTIVETPVDPLVDARNWLNDGLRVALATVVETWGSAPRPVGSQLAINQKGAFSGSVSGGCIENVLVSEALDVIDDGAPQVFEYGISDDQAQEVRLACGGTIRVYVERVSDADMIATLIEDRPVARIIDIETGSWNLFGANKDTDPLNNDAQAATTISRMMEEGSSGFLQVDGRDLMIVSHTLPRRLIATGAVHITQTLVPMAQAAGFETTVIDPRPAFARPERLPGVSVVTDPVASAMKALSPDANTAVVVLAHDPLLDDPALIAALNSPAYYIGCLGSKRTHGKRLERLRNAGFDDDALARLHGPIGLDIGGRSPGEISVSILAEAIATRYGKGTPL